MCYIPANLPRRVSTSFANRVVSANEFLCCKESLEGCASVDLRICKLKPAVLIFFKALALASNGWRKICCSRRLSKTFSALGHGGGLLEVIKVTTVNEFSLR